MIDPEAVRFTFVGELWWWRGPAPFHFVKLPADESAAIKAISSLVTYGWGAIPVWARIGATEFETTILPKDGRYVLPIRDQVRFAEGLELGDPVEVELGIRSLRPSR